MADSRFKIEHIGIKAQDMEKSLAFYSEVLGFKLLNRVKPGDVELAFLSLDGMVVELVEMRGPAACRDGLVNHLALKTEDIFAATEYLKRHDVELMTPAPASLGEGRFNLFFRGPSGEKLELFQGSF